MNWAIEMECSTVYQPIEWEIDIILAFKFNSTIHAYNWVLLKYISFIINSVWYT